MENSKVTKAGSTVIKFMFTNIKKIDSTNEHVSKFVFTVDDAVAEAVLYKYPTYEERTVICCSTQSGCPVGCRFCGAGDNFVRSLTAVEIVQQPVHLLNQTGIDPDKIKKLQIMFMSMGEPMLNFDALTWALFELHARYPQASLLISTSGPKVPAAFQGLRNISKVLDVIGLQFSVHESTDDARKKLIPSPTMTLHEIAVEGMEWHYATGRRPFFNYCVHEKNNTDEDIANLRHYFNPEIWEVTLSVICERDEYLFELSDYRRKLAEGFQSKLIQAGYCTRVFDPAGQDTANGCGQLWETQKWMKNHSDLVKASKGMNLPIRHAPRVNPIS